MWGSWIASVSRNSLTHHKQIITHFTCAQPKHWQVCQTKNISHHITLIINFIASTFLCEIWQNLIFEWHSTFWWVHHFSKNEPLRWYFQVLYENSSFAYASTYERLLSPSDHWHSREETKSEQHSPVFLLTDTYVPPTEVHSVHDAIVSSVPVSFWVCVHVQTIIDIG